MRLDLSRDADADLDDILEYGVKMFGLEVGRKYYFRFDETFRFLREFPEAGAVREELDGNPRSFGHERHRIFYDIEDERIFVLRVLHHAMDHRRAFKR